MRARQFIKRDELLNSAKWQALAKQISDISATYA
jgi:hypothetical protein